MSGGFDSATPAATSESLKQPSQHHMTPCGVFNGENISHDTTATTVTEFTGFNHNRALFSLLEQQSQKVSDSCKCLHFVTTCILIIFYYFLKSHGVINGKYLKPYHRN